MSYLINKTGIGSYSKSNDTGLGSLGGSGDITSEFYEMEPAIVLDIILDENHQLLKNKNIDVSSFPDNYKNTTPDIKDVDYTWIGRALVRQCFSQQGIKQDRLNWAMPLDVTGIVEYPLLNETVIVVKYFGNLYYTRRLNLRGFVNNNGDYKLEKVYGINNGTQTNTGAESLLTNKKNKNSDYIGSLGDYFISNNKIRRLRKFEGDTSIESRFGQSIRFSSYDSVRQNDISKYPDYKTDKEKSSIYGGGNPMILIRNRQRKIGMDNAISSHPKLPEIPIISDVEKNVGGLIDEDINHDGSSIHITSGLTTSKWQPTVYKSMFSSGKEEQALYSPNKSSNFIYPILNGDQIVINTDRLILSSRFGETFHYSKKRFGIVTDSECTIDAQDQIVMTTNNKTVINSPAIYLGQYDETNEPVLLGQTSVDWLFDLCNWLLAHTHWYLHNHPKTGGPSPEQTQLSVQQQQLKVLQSNLNTLMSRRVFVTGGGHAPGANGVAPENYDGTGKSVSINVINGNGVPGGFKGANRR